MGKHFPSHAVIARWRVVTTPLESASLWKDLESGAKVRTDDRGKDFVLRLSHVPERTFRDRRESPARRRAWVAATRREMLEELAAAASSLRLNRSLLLNVLEELGADETFVALVGEPSRIPQRQFGQALAVGLLLRHSWRHDDLEQCANRLGLTMPDPEAPPKGRSRSRAAARV